LFVIRLALLVTSLLRNYEEYHIVFHYTLYLMEGGESMKRNAAALATSLALLASSFGGPVFAQSSLDTGTGNDVPVVNDGQTGTTQDRGFDWWWLLPLLAIPLFFVFRSENRYDDRAPYRDQGLAGTKGGEARRRRLDDEEDETEDVL
jgi:hypothetical protein